MILEDYREMTTIGFEAVRACQNPGGKNKTEGFVSSVRQWPGTTYSNSLEIKLERGGSEELLCRAYLGDEPLDGICNKIRPNGKSQIVQVGGRYNPGRGSAPHLEVEYIKAGDFEKVFQL